MTNKIYLFLVAAIIAAVAGFFFHKNSLEGEKKVTDMLYELNFSHSKGGQVNLQHYKGEWLVVNFWATWCAPCREEIPELNQFHLTNQIKLIGIAIDDIDAVNKFQKKIPIKYPSYIIDDLSGVKLSQSMGNEKGVLPFTVLINPNNDIEKLYYGKVKIPQLSQDVANALNL